LYRPDCVVKIWLIAALILDNAESQSNVGKEVQARNKNVDDRHQPEEFRIEQSRQDQIPPQP